MLTQCLNIEKIVHRLSIFTNSFFQLSQLVYILLFVSLTYRKNEENLGHTRAEDREAYRKIFDYQSGNPDRKQTDNFRLGVSQSRQRKTEKFSVWLLLIDQEGRVN